MNLIDECLKETLYKNLTHPNIISSHLEQLLFSILFISNCSILATDAKTMAH